ncbi:DNA primase [Candidatus Caldarchaeum subterraneum]|uniref:DNA primase DnaG n=1 Tax=Caldiarchaeum subterraneum TaxID=311458 RepID=E6N9G1_CALS0|nr:DNA primase [Candidatus Caldarchaeum subterraneum]BAJ49761.1 DNA primase [Candidatus Caldarchaeum subterraneum]BAJ51551.1 DNA primase [Candidatus Caldarchaeum subterraneum]
MSTVTKYVIEARIEVDGPVDKNDVVGAVFGQTEGIFSSDLDLRELQKTGRIGRIEINVTTQGNKAVGKIIVPTSLDKYTTSLIAAMIESIDRVGPYQARAVIEKIEDTRLEKRKRIIERAKEILAAWEKQKVPENDLILRELEDAIVKTKVSEYGPEKLPAGPDVDSSDELIIVEGRADIINLLRYGYKNTIAVEGVKIPKSIAGLTKRKKRVIAFLDGDRGGDLILQELLQNCKIDAVARAPYGKEVEQLTAREIHEALEHAVPPSEALRAKEMAAGAERKTVPSELKNYVKQVDGTLSAVLLDQNFNEIQRMPVSELVTKFGEHRDAKYVVFDGVVTQRLVDLAASLESDVYLVGARIGDVQNKPPNVHIYTTSELINAS